MLSVLLTRGLSDMLGERSSLQPCRSHERSIFTDEFIGDGTAGNAAVTADLSLRHLAAWTFVRAHIKTKSNVLPRRAYSETASQNISGVGQFGFCGTFGCSPRFARLVRATGGRQKNSAHLHRHIRYRSPTGCKQPNSVWVVAHRGSSCAQVLQHENAAVVSFCKRFSKFSTLAFGRPSDGVSMN